MKNWKKIFSGLFLAVFILLPGFLAVHAAAGDETLTIRPDIRDGGVNCFRYAAYSGKQWTAGSEEAYIDLGDSDARAQECYYEVSFAGSGIEVFANKSNNHGRIQYSVDGEYVEVVDLYNSSWTQPQSVYRVTGLEEGEHVLKAVTLCERTGSAIVNQVAYVQVTHAPYTVTDVILEQTKVQMSEGQTQKLLFTMAPSYGSVADIAFTSENTGVAAVTAEGVVTAVGEGSTVIHLSGKSADFERTIAVTVAKSEAQLGGTISDTNTQHTQDRYGELSIQSVRTGELTAWKNDKAVSELVLYSKNGSLKNVTVEAGDFVGGKGVIKAENVTAVFIKSALAYNKGYVYGSEPPAATEENRSEVSDILYQTTPVDIPYDSLQPVWVEFAIPEDTEAGTYTGTLTVRADDTVEPLVFTYRLHVQDVTLPDAESFGETFDIELWQYPYTSAEYYGVEPFSEKHLAIMESSMLKYKEIGGHAITTSIVEEAWTGQTYSANAVHYPSMVKWTKEADDSFSYDYTDFDKWIEFNKSLGIGDKIVLYSIAPWHNCITYWESDKLVYEPFTPGSARYTQVWTDFLEDLAAHLEQKGWFEDAYIGIDEQGFSTYAFDLNDSITDSQGQPLKTAGAMDSFVEKKALALRVTDLNVGDTAAAAHPADFENLVAERAAKGYRTTLYSCTGHMPGNFALNKPVESYWSIVNAGKSGTAGFLRWAYDAWVENPLEDVTHSKYEAGDCFLIYPDVKDAEHPVSKSSVRLEKMAEGVRDVNKLMLIERENPAFAGKIQALYEKIKTTAQSRPSAYNAYLGDEAIARLIQEMDAFKNGVAELTYEYIAERDGLTGSIEALSIKEGSQMTLEAGSLAQLHAVFVPENVISTEVFWTSSDNGVASVDVQGKVTAGREGKAVITAASAWDSSKKASITITVSPKKQDDAPDKEPGKLPDAAGQEPEKPGDTVTAPGVRPEVSAPAKVKLSSAKRISGRKIKLKWKKVSGANGYEIYRSAKKKGKYTKIATIKKGKTTAYTDRKVKKKKIYYYKVRAYRTTDGKKLRGAFSSVKKGKG